MARVVIVDGSDNVVGAEHRKRAKRLGLIVRIIRIFLFNSSGELLLQQKGENVDFAGLWDQSVGGHVDKGESYLEAAQRELTEELGLSELELIFLAKYYTESEYGKGNHFKRFNALYFARSDEPPKPHPIEVAQLRWVKPEEVEREIAERPSSFTQGFIKAYRIYQVTSTSR